MAQDDIYNNKRRYEKFRNNIEKLAEKPRNGSRRKYYCKARSNLKYFKKLIRRFEVDDISYIRRMRLLQSMKFLVHYVECDLKDVNGLDKEEIIIKIRETYSPTILTKIERDIKRIGKVIFNEEDLPNFFKELEIKVDVSTQRARKDKLSYEEFDKIMKFFSNDIVIQSYLSLAFEALARPQEICYLKIEDIEFHDSYAKLTVSEHGKEGIKRLLSIDSFPYLIKMFNQHRNRNNKKEFLFLNKEGNQLTPTAINKRLKFACNKLEIDKPITCYSLKRFGVTFRRLNGDDDVTIQRIAGWNSTRQLKTYDQSNQEDVFKKELIKRGLIKDKELLKYAPKTKPCPYCNELVGFAETICDKCKHVVDMSILKERVNEEQKAEEEIKEVFRFALKNPEMSFIEIMDKFRKSSL